MIKVSDIEKEKKCIYIKYIIEIYNINEWTVQKESKLLKNYIVQRINFFEHEIVSRNFLAAEFQVYLPSCSIVSQVWEICG